MPRILLISNISPIPQWSGSAQRTFLLSRAISEFGLLDICIVEPNILTNDHSQLKSCNFFNKIFFLESYQKKKENRSTNKNYAEKLIQLWQFYNKPYAFSKTTNKQLQDILEECSYDLLICRYLSTALRCGLDKIKSSKIIIDFDDLDWNAWESRLGKQDETLHIKTYIATCMVKIFAKQKLKRKAKRFDQIWLANPLDKKDYGKSNRIVVIPNIPFYDANQTEISRVDAEYSSDLCFMGSLNFYHNIVGLEQFLNMVWPHILRNKPETKLLIAGSNLDKNLKKRWHYHQNVRLVSPIENPEKLYSNTKISIAPIYSGGGTKIKVLEALKFKIPCVCTPHAARGLDHLMHGEDILIAKSDTEFGNSVLRLLNDISLRIQLGNSGCRSVNTHYSFTCLKENVVSSIKGLRKY